MRTPSPTLGIGQRRFIFLLVSLVFSFSVFGFGGNTYYVSQSGGSVNCGADGTQNTQPYTWFNSGGHYAAGDTIKLCGTINGPDTVGGTVFTFQASGSSGNPITLFWESNASISVPACGTKDNGGCINTNGHVFLTLNGNGTPNSITSTSNGTAGSYTNQVASQGIMAIGCNSCTFENLAITNIYVMTSYTDDAPASFSADPSGIWINGSNYTITNNTFDQMNHGVTSPFGNGDTGNTFSNNTIDHVNQGISLGNNNSNTMSNIVISGNHLKNMATWDNHNNNYHHDGIFFFQDSAQANSIRNVYIYNNLADGDMGANATAWMYYNSGLNGIYVFNNVLLNPANRGGFLLEGGYAGDQNFYVYNNFLDCGSGNGNGFNYSSVSGFTITNNAIQDCSTYYSLTGVANLTKDYNVYKNFSSGEPHSINTTNLQVSSTGVPQAGSPMIHDGSGHFSMLASLCSGALTALCRDYSGNARATSGQYDWDAGAYVYGSSNGPVPPTGLAAVVQ